MSLSYTDALPGYLPGSQDEGQPVQGRIASDEVLAGIKGGAFTSQSEEFVTVAGAGESVHALADPAPAPDANEETWFEHFYLCLAAGLRDLVRLNELQAGAA